MAATTHDSRQYGVGVSADGPGGNHRNPTAVLGLSAVRVQHLDGDPIARDVAAVSIEYGDVAQKVHLRSLFGDDLRIDDIQPAVAVDIAHCHSSRSLDQRV